MASKFSVEYIAGGNVAILSRYFFLRNISSIIFLRYAYYAVTCFTQFYLVQVLLKIQSESLRYSCKFCDYV